MDIINESLMEFFHKMGFLSDTRSLGIQLMIILGVLILSFVLTKLFRHVLVPLVQKITARTRVKWDDYIFNERMMMAFSRTIPPIVWYIFLPTVFDEGTMVLVILLKACLVYMVVASIMLINTFLNTLYEISNEHEVLRNRPLKGVYQMISLLAIAVGIIIIVSILIDKDATRILAGLGASAAVLMLIFKDSLLGLVAGIQLTVNDMLHPGDWITMNKYGANGYVTEVSLTTVKVQNFDKTITTIPAYALVSDSFQNWRGMHESGGRRIKRYINIDITTVHFCSEEELRSLASKGLYSADKMEDSDGVVNLYVFRRYALDYICNRKDINQDFMRMVRVLQPTSEGLPVEIYCFTSNTEWLVYESIQGAIFDHLIAMLPAFGLRAFQRPSGADLQEHGFSGHALDE
ncbi:MAG: hypothetical protein BHV77_15085 [Bacteroides sp. 43_108]|nr:MAG: hypothetical protein BHV77_15085 [Bacteroides sp. 43_108]